MQGEEGMTRDSRFIYVVLILPFIYLYVPFNFYPSLGPLRGYRRLQWAVAPR